MSLRVALIGCGKIGSEFADDPLVTGIYTHAGAWRACAGTELVAVCDRDAERVRRCAERHSVADAFIDVDAMLDGVRPDVVSICTPDDSHADVLARVLRQGGVRAVLMEKPLALELGAARELVDMAGRLGIRLAVNYSRRYSAGHQELAQRLRNGTIGTIQCVSGYYTKGTLHNGTHWFDLARMLVGDIAAIRGFDRLGETGDDPTLDVRLDFRGGSSGCLHGLDAGAYSLFEMDILGTQGRVRIVDSGHVFEFSHNGDSPYYTGYRTLLPQGRESGRLEDTLLHAARDLIDSLLADRQPLCSGGDALAALAIGIAARQSAGAGGEMRRP